MTKEEITMLQIGETIISLDILEKKFCCNLEKCHGICCIEGDSGAPVSKEEKKLIERNIDKILPFMNQEGQRAVKDHGCCYIDIEKDMVTQLVEGNECAYVVNKNGISMCAIELAYEQNEITFRKPVSCHLYPIRTKEYKDFTAVNYDEWEICSDALIHGEKHGIPLYIFCKDSLIRKFGQEWYDQLCYAAENIDDLEQQ